MALRLNRDNLLCSKIKSNVFCCIKKDLSLLFAYLLYLLFSMYNTDK